MFGRVGRGPPPRQGIIKGEVGQCARRRVVLLLATRYSLLASDGQVKQKIQARRGGFIDLCCIESDVVQSWLARILAEVNLVLGTLREG